MHEWTYFAANRRVWTYHKVILMCIFYLHIISFRMKRQRNTEEYLEMENAIVAAIFQIGLNQSSPKSLISLMPETPELTRE